VSKLHTRITTFRHKKSTCSHNGTNVKYKMYNSKSVPIMDYCSSVWGFKLYSRPDTIHNRIIKFFLGVNKYTSRLVILGSSFDQKKTEYAMVMETFNMYGYGNV